MDSVAINQWKEKLFPALFEIPGVNTVGTTNTGITINLEYNNDDIQDQIMAVFVNAGADDVPYKTNLVGRVMKLTV